ncbi:MAG: rRNA maturation RNase YbeY [Phycisphaerales bacterium]|nr:MAG: rRNA maturation RNase YbeY [Phycisphaerales bacterium]
MDEEPAYDIAVTRASGDAPGCEALLREAIEATLHRHRTPAVRISVGLVDDAHMARLNELYRNSKGTTDVLSFDLRDDPSTPLVSNGEPKRVAPGTAGGPVEGEIVVSVDTAAREARKRGHALEAELALYAVHGTLHLLGYDDRHEPDAAHMHDIEDYILSEIGLGRVYRTGPQ